MSQPKTNKYEVYHPLDSFQFNILKSLYNFNLINLECGPRLCFEFMKGSVFGSKEKKKRKQWNQEIDIDLINPFFV